LLGGACRRPSASVNTKHNQSFKAPTSHTLTHDTHGNE
jgi:hypothetical protein